MEIRGCEPDEACKYFPDCYADIHHLYFPAGSYRTALEKEFRQAPQNKILSCRRLHDEDHLKEPPQKPSRDEMLLQLGGLGIGRNTEI